MYLVFFFFQAEDGIRDLTVTGVQRVLFRSLRPSNTLLLDEPTNHLDLDSKEVLLDALVDYGGTLVFVSHDRYFVERLATKIIEVGKGTAIAFPGTYKEFLWHKDHRHEGREAPAVEGKGQRAESKGRKPDVGRALQDRRQEVHLD